MYFRYGIDEDMRLRSRPVCFDIWMEFDENRPCQNLTCTELETEFIKLVSGSIIFPETGFLRSKNFHSSYLRY